VNSISGTAPSSSRAALDRSENRPVVRVGTAGRHGRGRDPAHFPVRHSSIGRYASGLLASAGPLLCSENTTKPHERCSEHERCDVVDHRLSVLSPRASAKRLGSRFPTGHFRIPLCVHVGFEEPCLFRLSSATCTSRLSSRLTTWPIVSWSITEDGTGNGLHLEMDSDEVTAMPPGGATRPTSSLPLSSRDMRSRFA
jgi:hypothetical protein